MDMGARSPAGNPCWGGGEDIINCLFPGCVGMCGHVVPLEIDGHELFLLAGPQGWGM